MNCNEIDKCSLDYLRGMLSDEKKRAVEEHLDTCEVCKVKIGQMRLMADRLMEMKPVVQAGAEFIVPPQSRGKIRGRRVAAVGAAVVVVLFAVILQLQGPKPGATRVVIASRETWSQALQPVLPRPPQVHADVPGSNAITETYGVDEKVPEAAVLGESDKWEAAVYSSCAPKVVYIGSQSSFGTGFLVGKGLILTSRHVVNEFIQTPERRADVWLGRLGADGRMDLVKEPLGAGVVKWDADKDLALLRLDQSPAADEFLGRVKPLTLAETTQAGKPIAIVGQSRSEQRFELGILWSFKPGIVADVGPLGSMDMLIQYVWEEILETQSEHSDNAMTETQKAAIGELAPKYDVLALAFADAIPGDCGSPVLNCAGEVVGVLQGGLMNSGGSLTACYAIASSEIRAFLAEVPDVPAISSLSSSAAPAEHTHDDVDKLVSDIIGSVSEASSASSKG